MTEQNPQGKTPSDNPLQSFRVIFNITFGQTIRSKKTVFMLIATFLPVIVAIFYRILTRDLGPDQPLSRMFIATPEHALSQFYMFFLLFLSILVALFYGTSIIADEVENRTITYLFTRPIRRYSIILGKFAAYISGVFLVLIPPFLLVFLIVATDSRISSNFASNLIFFGKQLGVIVLSLVVYGAIFTFFGARLKRPVLFGLLLAFGWEKIVIVVPGIVRKFSVVHYLLSALPIGPGANRLNILPPKEVIPNTSASLSIAILLIIALIFFALSIFTIYRKEYRFE